MEAALQRSPDYDDGADSPAAGHTMGAPHDGLSDLLARVAAGDGAGMAALYDETSPILYGLLTRMLGAGTAAEETLIEVYSCVWREAASYRPGGASPLAWLVSTARECALRGKCPDASGSGTVGEASKQFEAAVKGTGGDGQLSSCLEAERARAALGGLSAERREALRLSYFHGLGQVEAAFGLSTEEARALVRDALKDYSEILEGRANR